MLSREGRFPWRAGLQAGQGRHVVVEVGAALNRYGEHAQPVYL